MALQDLRAVEVTTIGNSFERVRPHDRLCGFPDACQVRAIRSGRRHLVRHDQVVLGLYRDMHVVADDARAAAAGARGFHIHDDAELHVDRQVEQCEVTLAALHLQLVLIDQTWLGLRGGLAPTIFPLFHGVRRLANDANDPKRTFARFPREDRKA